jgi:hypothetical protein
MTPNGKVTGFSRVSTASIAASTDPSKPAHKNTKRHSACCMLCMAARGSRDWFPRPFSGRATPTTHAGHVRGRLRRATIEVVFFRPGSYLVRYACESPPAAGTTYTFSFEGRTNPDSAQTAPVVSIETSGSEVAPSNACYSADGRRVSTPHLVLAHKIWETAEEPLAYPSAYRLGTLRRMNL